MMKRLIIATVVTSIMLQGCDLLKRDNLSNGDALLAAQDFFKNGQAQTPFGSMRCADTLTAKDISIVDKHLEKDTATVEVDVSLVPKVKLGAMQLVTGYCYGFDTPSWPAGQPKRFRMNLYYQKWDKGWRVTRADGGRLSPTNTASISPTSSVAASIDSSEKAAVELDSKAFVEQIYSHIVSTDEPIWYPDRAPGYFDSSMSFLLSDDRNRAPLGSVGTIDYNPFCNCQDVDGITYIVSSQYISDATSRVFVDIVFVKSSDHEKKRMIFDLVKENNQWRIHDIAEKDQTSLRAILIDAAQHHNGKP